MPRFAARAALLTLLVFLAVPAGARAQTLVDGSGAAAEVPKPSILLFWAIWCAPCREETDNLAALNRAAGPMPVIVVPLDSDRRTRRALADVDPRQLRFVRTGAIAWMQRWTDAVGLPAAVAIDKDGKRCAIKFGGVTTADLAAWRDRCR